MYILYEIYRKGEMIDYTQSSKYQILDEGNIKKLIIKKCTTEDIAEYTAIVANVKTSSRLKVEGKLLYITPLYITCNCKSIIYTHLGIILDILIFFYINNCSLL